MKHGFSSIFLLIVLLHLERCCAEITNGTQTEEKLSKEVQLIGAQVKTFWTWIQQQAKSEDTFVGRCAGAFKKMRMAFSFIIFMLGVIVTALAFLSAMAFKGLGMGVAILVVTSLGLYSKLTSLKHLKHVGDYGDKGAIHLHIHNKGGWSGGGGGGHGPIWYDRQDTLEPKNEIERNAIIDLYRRIGLSNPNLGSSIYARKRR